MFLFSIVAGRGVWRSQRLRCFVRNSVSSILLSSAVACIAVVSSACSITGLPGDLTMGELSSEQAIQVCESTQDFQERELSDEERKIYACNLRGIAAGVVAQTVRGSYEEACEEARSDCLRAESNEEAEGAQAEEPACDNASFPEGCDATIAQYEACQRDTIQSIRDYNASFSCAPPEESEAQGEEEEGPCSVYYEACYSN